MQAERDNTEQRDPEDTSIDLPLVNISKTDVLGALFVHTDNPKDLYRKAIDKLQMFIVEFAKEQVSPLRESGCFNEEELELYEKKACVISPLTIALYLHYLQMQIFSRLPDSEKERMLLEKLPDQFKARYKGNAACRNAVEGIQRDPEDTEAEEEPNEENGSLIDYLKSVIGPKIKALKENGWKR